MALPMHCEVKRYSGRFVVLTTFMVLTTLDGRPWKHCEECGHCVKQAWVHCTTCCCCRPPGHPCPPTLPRGCYICGDLDHKRRYCTTHIPMATGRSEKLAAAILDADLKSTNEVASTAGFQPKMVAIRKRTKEAISTAAVRKRRKTVPQSMAKDCTTSQTSGSGSSTSRTQSHSSLAPTQRRVHPRSRLLREGPHTWRGKRRVGARGPRKDLAKK